MFVKLLIPATLAAGLCAPMAFTGGFHGNPLEARLKLTTDQKTALHGVIKRHKPALAVQVAALAEARNGALDAGMDPAVPEATWRLQQEKVAGAMYEVAKELRSAYLEALPLLTETQKAEGKALLKKAHRHMEGMHGRHHGSALGFLKDRLELSEAQAAAIQTVVASHGTALAAKRETLHKAMIPALEAALDPATSQATFDERYGAAREAGLALSAEVRTVYLEVLPQLTPEQREAAKGLVVDFRNAVDGVRKLALGF